MNPVFKSVHDPENVARLSYGLAFAKYTGSRGKVAANDADAEFIHEIRQIFNKNNIKYQFGGFGKVEAGLTGQGGGDPNAEREAAGEGACCRSCPGGIRMRQDEMHGAWLAGWLLAVRQVLALIRKELVALFKEPANRIILFVPALLQALLYGYVGTYDLHDTPYAVLDQSRSEEIGRAHV